MSSATVIVEPYSPLWPSHFLAIKTTLAAHLSSVPILSIEHVGSTSVPGLTAKPIIDVDIIVKREDLQLAIEGLVSKGFTHLGDLGIEDRHAFRDPDQEPMRNVYVCVNGSAQLRNHLGVRDTLRKNAELREEYGKVKMDLAEQGTNIVDYIEAKSTVLQKILRTAGILSDSELKAIAAANRKGGRFGVVKTEMEGLVLREFVLADKEAFWRLESIEEVVQYQSFGPRTKEQACDLVAEILHNSSVTPRTHIELAVEYQGTFIGRVGAKISIPPPDENAPSLEESISLPHADLWFSFQPSHQGKGLATGAMKSFIPLLKAPMELEIECDPRNTGSMKMAERLGFEKVSQEEGVFECKGEWVGSAVFRKIISSE